jgi:hypothetical protein
MLRQRWCIMKPQWVSDVLKPPNLDPRGILRPFGATVGRAY